MAEISKQALLVANNTDFPNNNAGAITPAILRSFNTDMIDSTVNQTVYTANSSSWNVSINALNTFSASQQPTFNALNAFTASQLTINTGYNSATQSLSASIAPLQPQITSLQNWTSSINQIADNGIVQGTSTRLHFYGLVSASIVPNVNGAIASINIEQDSTKVGTGSFNQLTQSVNSILDYTASLKTAITVNGTSASIAGNLDVVGTINAYKINTTIESSSVIFSSGSNVFGDADNDTQTLNGKVTISNGLTLTGNLTASGLIDGVDLSSFYSNVNATTQSLNNSIQAINQTTASTDSKWNDLQPISGTLLQTASFSNNTITFTKLNGTTNVLNGFALTGSNDFIGNQRITGSLIISSSAAIDLEVTGGISSTGTIISSGSGGSTTLGNIAVTLSSNAATASAFFGRYNINQASGSNRIGIAANPVSAGYTNAGSSAGIFVASGSLSTVATYTPIQFENAWQYTDGRVTITTPLVAKNKSIVTGSVVGNLVPLTITSNTASMDLSQGNFFSLTLASGSTTRLAATNIVQGQTINLLLTQPSTTGSLTFTPSFKFSGGVAVSASAVASAQDILTFVTFDTTSVYTAIIKNLS
jgi:hypothetical protein